MAAAVETTSPRRGQVWEGGQARTGARWQFTVPWKEIREGRHAWGLDPAANGGSGGHPAAAAASAYHAQHRQRQHGLVEEVLPDVVILDRVKYHVNAGSVFRHLPLQLGRSYLFLTDSQRSKQQEFMYTSQERAMAYPTTNENIVGPFGDKHGQILDRDGHAGSFVKEAIRISNQEQRTESGVKLIFEHEADAGQRNIRPGDNGVDLGEVLQFLRERNYNIVACENIEALQQAAAAVAASNSSTSGPTTVIAQDGGDSSTGSYSCEGRKRLQSANIEPLWQSVAVANAERPVAFIFGSENMSLPCRLVQVVDAGVYIPSLAPPAAAELDQHEGQGAGTGMCNATSTDAEVLPSCKAKAMHTFNLSCAASVVLSTRAQHLWFRDQRRNRAAEIVTQESSGELHEGSVGGVDDKAEEDSAKRCKLIQ